MSYVLELISKEDQQKIKNDFKSNEKHYRSLISRVGFFSQNDSQLRWTIDRDKGYYFFYKPAISKERERDCLFYYENCIYQFTRLWEANESQTKIIHKLQFNEHVEPSLLPALTSEIKKAYECFGLYGRGPDSSEPLSFIILNKEKK